MKLIDLDPRWLLRDGKRVGFIFKSPLPDKREWWQSCFPVPTPRMEQNDFFNAALADLSDGSNADYLFTKVQGCKEECGWAIAGGIENASFETMSVTPSLDGSAGGLWHGHITNGEIV